MGLAVCIFDSASNRHPEWDSTRYAGDQELVRAVFAVPGNCVGGEKWVSAHRISVPPHRPTHEGMAQLDALAESLPEGGKPQKFRLLNLLECLRTDERWGVYASW